MTDLYMFHKTVTAARARELALRCAGAATGSFYVQNRTADGLYELGFVAGDMDCTCYVSTATGEVLGFLSEPKAA